MGSQVITGTNSLVYGFCSLRFDFDEDGVGKIKNRDRALAIFCSHYHCNSHTDHVLVDTPWILLQKTLGFQQCGGFCFATSQTIKM